jgi:hypothetical protein
VPTIELPGIGTLTELETAYKSQMSTVLDGVKTGAIKVDGGNVEVSSDDAIKFKSAFANAKEVKFYMDLIQQAQDAHKPKVDTEPSRSSVAVSTAIKSLQTSGFGDVAQAFVESDEFRQYKSSRAADMAQAYELEVFDLPSLGFKDVYAGMNTGTITRTLGSIQFDGLVPRGQRRARIRDLFPVATTNANLIDFFQVIGFAENRDATGNNATVSGGGGNARPVADYVAGNFGLKNKSNLQVRSNQAPVRTIAHWEAAHRNVLDDEPQLQSTINNELLYGLALEEDYQILKGSGAGNDLLGIMNTQFIQTIMASAGELYSDTLRKAATLSILANYPSTGYVLHPNDWETVELQKGTGDGQYMLITSIAIGLNTQVWRQPVVESPVMDEGTFLTGAFGTGAQLYDRQVANIRISEHHSDYFVRDAVAILAEERLALATKRPESFIKGAFAGTSAFPADEDANPAT